MATLGQKAAAHNFLARPILPASGWAELRKGSPQPLAHFNIGFASFFALVWAISTTAKALSAYTTREVVSLMYRWRCPKRGIGCRIARDLIDACELGSVNHGRVNSTRVLRGHADAVDSELERRRLISSF